MQNWKRENYAHRLTFPSSQLLVFRFTVPLLNLLKCHTSTYKFIDKLGARNEGFI